MGFLKKVRKDGVKKAYRDRKSQKYDSTTCWYDVISYDETVGRYRLDRTTIKEDERPKDAKNVSNEKHHYAEILVKGPEIVPIDERGKLNPTATTLYNYYMDKSVNKALAGNFKPSAVNMKTLLIAGVAGAVAVVIMLKIVGMV